MFRVLVFHSAMKLKTNVIKRKKSKTKAPEKKASLMRC